MSLTPSPVVVDTSSSQITNEELSRRLDQLTNLVHQLATQQQHRHSPLTSSRSLATSQTPLPRQGADLTPRPSSPSDGWVSLSQMGTRRESPQKDDHCLSLSLPRGALCALSTPTSITPQHVTAPPRGFIRPIPSRVPDKPNHGNQSNEKCNDGTSPSSSTNPSPNSTEAACLSSSSLPSSSSPSSSLSLSTSTIPSFTASSSSDNLSFTPSATVSSSSSSSSSSFEILEPTHRSTLSLQSATPTDCEIVPPPHVQSLLSTPSPCTSFPFPSSSPLSSSSRELTSTPTQSFPPLPLTTCISSLMPRLDRVDRRLARLEMSSREREGKPRILRRLAAVANIALVCFTYTRNMLRAIATGGRGPRPWLLRLLWASLVRSSVSSSAGSDPHADMAMSKLLVFAMIEGAITWYVLTNICILYTLEHVPPFFLTLFHYRPLSPSHHLKHLIMTLAIFSYSLLYRSYLFSPIFSLPYVAFSYLLTWHDPPRNTTAIALSSTLSSILLLTSSNNPTRTLHGANILSCALYALSLYLTRNKSSLI